jgi:hypothetical protein
MEPGGPTSLFKAILKPMERSLIEMTATDVTPHIFPMLMRQRAAMFCALAQNRVFQHNPPGAAIQLLKAELASIAGTSFIC